ncbi:type IV conjugative transfer system protein TraL [Sutterella seckii]|uniref:Type IV conjugative transfer system protein TraL n=2 Tax=Sutterellaceae TaxID=995019 RepID=A0AAI9SBE2_9BURK|nr:type IV conjugative transfer system protein TraL [Sutterella seckii]
MDAGLTRKSPVSYISYHWTDSRLSARIAHRQRHLRRRRTRSCHDAVDSQFHFYGDDLMSAPEGYAVPRSLEIKPRFLFWSAEHVIITCSLIIIGGIIDHLILGTLAGILTASWWSRISAKQSSGFALHLGYWYVDGLKLERTPPSAMRRFVG